MWGAANLQVSRVRVGGAAFHFVPGQRVPEGETMKIHLEKSKHANRPLVWVVVFLFCIPLAVRAQVITASIRGIVTDEQNAAIAGSEVTITNTGTGFTRTVQSGPDGAY